MENFKLGIKTKFNYDNLVEELNNTRKKLGMPIIEYKDTLSFKQLDEYIQESKNEVLKIVSKIEDLPYRDELIEAFKSNSNNQLNILLFKITAYYKNLT